MRRPLVAAATAAWIVLSGGAVVAEDAAQVLDSYQLANGLQVILIEDHKVPKVAVTVSYRAGAVNEPAGRSGFAHLFEHLMFTGTPAYPQVDATMTALGVEHSGYTIEDATVYYATGVASTLPVIVSVLADQMANIGSAVDQADLDLQRAVVINEMRENVLDAPAASAFEAFKAGLYQKPHPYSRATIGSIPDLEAATLDDVKTFFNAYYGPNNAVLAVVGDFESATARAMIEDTFGRIDRGPDIAVPAIPDAPPARIRIEAEDAVTTPLVYVGFTGPGAVSPDNAAMRIAADLLGNEFGPLRRALVNTGIASFVGAHWMPGRLGGRFIVYASASAGVSAQTLEAALRDTLEQFRATAIDAADFERSRLAHLVVMRTALEGYQTRSGYIATRIATTGETDGLLEDDPDLLAATPAVVEAAIRRVLVLDDAGVAIVRPGNRGSYPAVLSQPSGVPQALPVAARPPVDIPRLTAGEPRTVALPARQTATLGNGIEIIHYAMPDAPLHYLTAIVSGGYNNDPPGSEGLHELAIGIAGRGAGNRDLAALGRASRDIGASVGTWAGALQSGATLSVPPEALSAGVELLADMVQQPRFEPAEWDILVAQTLEGLAQRESDLQSVAQRTLNEVLFVPGPGEPAMDASIGSVKAITLEDAESTFRRMFVPSTATIYSVGALPLEDVVMALEGRFGTWQTKGEGTTPKPRRSAVFPEERRVLLRPMAGASQALILMARAAPGLDDPGFARAYAVGRLLGGDFSSRLNSIIREQKGYSYGVTAGLMNGLRHNGGMVVFAPVQADAAGAALEEMFSGFQSLATSPVTAAEIAHTVTVQQVVLAGLPETAESLFGALVGAEGDGISLAESLAALDRVSKLELPEVQSEAEALAALDRAVVVIVGDPALIAAQLEAIGIADVELMVAGGG
jgi:predicted Zn-dependent peptidase